MQCITVFLDITKVADFRLNNADVCRTHGMSHLIYIFFGSSLGNIQQNQVSSLKGGPFWHPPPTSNPEMTHLE